MKISIPQSKWFLMQYFNQEIKKNHFRLFVSVSGEYTEWAAGQSRLDTQVVYPEVLRHQSKHVKQSFGIPTDTVSVADRYRLLTTWVWGKLFCSLSGDKGEFVFGMFIL